MEDNFMKHVCETFDDLYEKRGGDPIRNLSLCAYMIYSGLNNLKYADINKIDNADPEMIEDFKKLIKIRNYMRSLRPDVVTFNKADDIDWK